MPENPIRVDQDIGATLNAGHAKCCVHLPRADARQGSAGEERPRGRDANWRQAEAIAIELGIESQAARAGYGPRPFNKAIPNELGNVIDQLTVAMIRTFSTPVAVNV